VAANVNRARGRARWPPETALAFTTPAGLPLRLSNCRRNVFDRAKAASGTDPRFRRHDLRHAAASLMIQAGYPAKMIQSILGHASITTTLDLYGHLFPGDLGRYANLLGEAADEARAANLRPIDVVDADEGPTQEAGHGL